MPAPYSGNQYFFLSAQCKAYVLLCNVIPVLDPTHRADADLKLLSSKRLPKDAFKDKVVWITGASQVLLSDLLSAQASANPPFECPRSKLRGGTDQMPFHCR